MLQHDFVQYTAAKAEHPEDGYCMCTSEKDLENEYKIHNYKKMYSQSALQFNIAVIIFTNMIHTYL